MKQRILKLIGWTEENLYLMMFKSMMTMTLLLGVFLLIAKLFIVLF